MRDELRARLRERVAFWTRRLKVRPEIVRVRRMTRKWGSCSTRGIITLAEDLADRESGFQDFVIVHELLHLRVPNHGKVFKALMRLHVPGWRQYKVKKTAS
jgi:predicted metal-dependent hydrolase